jgi:hypothetical protein
MSNPKKSNAIKFIKNAKFNEIVDFITVKKPNYAISAKDFISIIPNSNITWEEADKIYDIFKSRGFRPNLACLNIMLNYCTPGPSQWYSSVFKKHICDLLDDSVPLETIMDVVVGKPSSFAYFMQTLNVLGKNTTVPLKFFHQFISGNYASENDMLALLDSLECKPNSETLRIASEWGFITLVDKLCKQGIQITLECYHKLLRKHDKTPNHHRILLDLLNNLDDKPNLETLRIACSQGTNVLVDNLCNQGIVPDQQCMEEACREYYNTDIICKLFNYKLYVNKQCFLNMLNTNTHIPKNSFNDTVQLLIFCGLKLDAESFGYAKARGYTFSNEVKERFL